MSFARKASLPERLIDAGVPPLVGAGAAAPPFVLAPVALHLWLAGAAFVAAMLVAGVLLAVAGRNGDGAPLILSETLALPDFARVEETPELLLDDPLSNVDGDSRVVRLFAPDTMAVPGELAERIDRWLEDARSREMDREPVRLAAGGGGHGPAASPASAALHAALADIRRTLR